jgi:hypothetical protein
MLSRNNEEIEGLELPQEWLNEITNAVYSTYESSIKSKNLSLKTYGELHKGEVCLAFCLSSIKSDNTNAVSLILSLDLKDKDDPKETLDNTINQSSEFFDLLFSGQKEDIFQPNWTKSDLKENNFYFKITRENIALSIEANKLLKNS